MNRLTAAARVLAVLAAGAVLLTSGCALRSRPHARVYVIGLDGATFDLLNPWMEKGELPNLRSLMAGGAYGELRSIYPILSPVAWTSMFTGVNPGKHGIFDFQHPDPAEPGKEIFYTAQNRRAAAVWQLLSDAGMSVAVLNIPMTWPPDEVKGVMVSGFPFPDKPQDQINYTYPADLKNTLGAEYPLDKMGEGLVAGSESAKLAEIVDSRDAVSRVLVDWIKNRHDDFTWGVITATDRIQHFFWGMMDPKHPYYTPQLGHDYGNAIHEFWIAMDKRLGEMLAALPKDATVLVVSDHGFGPIYREVNTFNWFNSTPMVPYVKSHQVPDLYITNGIFRYRLGTSWPMGPEYGNFVNMFLKEAAALTDPATGVHPIEKVYRREDLYAGRQVSKGPDLVMIEAPECYIGTGDPSLPLPPVSALHSTSYSAYHRPNGIFIIKGPNIRQGQLVGASLLDVAPTILHLMGQPIPTEMDGRLLSAVFTPEWLKQHPPTYTDGAKLLKEAPEPVLSPEERESLHSLPYIK